ncbi:META domain-containing protein [Kribbella deserti]|uniref:META domain-containing protein n=1 Tax=Kribbella deserti TaxID=1926257 RepID=A0ABV6QTB8_9ACTN
MSKTELEEDLRSTLQRAAASVPFAPDLVTRAEAQVRRERRTWAAAGAAAVAVASVAAVGIVLQRGSEAPAPFAGPPPAAVQSVTPGGTPTAPASANDVTGSWRPLRIAGFNGMRKPRPDQPFLAFSPDGTWRGSDGCNGIHGTYKIGPNGEFSSTTGPQTLIGCDYVPNADVIAATRKVVGDRATLRLLGADGREVATYVRTR